MNMNSSHNSILKITQTGLLVALLIALQWLTAGTQAFAGQYITGSLVNGVLAVAAMACGLWSGLVVAFLSPFCAFLLGIGPKLLQVVPCIALGNAVFVLGMRFLTGKNRPFFWRLLGLLIAAAAKFAVLYGAVVLLLIPLMADSLPPKQVQTFTVMFSWPQLITALLGGILALLIVPILRKANKD